jgi:uncharacterized protein
MIRNRRLDDSFDRILARRLTRRSLVQALAAAPVLAACSVRPSADTAGPAAQSSLGFQPIAGSTRDAVIVPRGYTWDVVVRWGDSLRSGVADLDTRGIAQSSLLAAEEAVLQESRFGYNCDAIQFFPLAPDGSRGVLCVNNEYTNDELLFPGRHFDDRRHPDAFRDFMMRHPTSVAFTQAAHGISVVEIARVEGRWRLQQDSPRNRRVTANSRVEICGPARGHRLMRTSYDDKGTWVRGTLANCAGGKTPWRTYLSAEENLEDYFGNFAGLRSRRDLDASVLEAHRRFWLWESASIHGWEFVDARFDVAREPTEPLRFGWIVELDPLDPQSTPCKRTALGRFAHEAASPIVARDGRVAVYMGDDDQFEYVYKFVSREHFDPRQPDVKRDLLDDGILYVARFDADGTGEWLPLVWKTGGPIGPRTGFTNQADVLIRTRAAADVLGATPMDRPEDVEPDPATGRIYIACTKNEARKAASVHQAFGGRDLELGPDAANPRGYNLRGHIIEITEADGDHTATRFNWDVFILAGDPKRGRLVTRSEDLAAASPAPDDTYYAGFADASQLSPLGCPDNVGFDRAGNLWIVTDGDQPRGTNNGCFACPTEGPTRGRLQQFMSAPVAAEICGCEFTPDDTTLFLSIQHPGEGGDVLEPRSHWPDGGNAVPRPTVIAIRREDGGPVGGG